MGVKLLMGAWPFFLFKKSYITTMKRILIITAMSGAAMCASVAAELIHEKSETLVIVAGHDFQKESCTMLCPVLSVYSYVAEPNGEVVPDYVPAVVEATLEGKTEEVFHPPDNANLQLHKSTRPNCDVKGK